MVQRLAVSIASHSPLMQQASLHFTELINRIHFRPPQVPLIANISAQALTTVDELRAELSGQLTRPVQWTRSVQTMVSEGIDTIVEIGPKQVLSGLVKRITSDARPVTLSDTEIVKLLEQTE
jgi:[acyl-carrier-protein] S-malonyltransferase